MLTYVILAMCDVLDSGVCDDCAVIAAIFAVIAVLILIFRGRDS